MLFNHQNDTYRLHDRGTAISIDVLEGSSWVEIMYECIPAHQGERLFVVSTKDLVLIISARLTVSLMIQPRVCVTELREIMKPLGLCNLVDVEGVSQYLIFLFRKDCNELRLVQTAYRLIEGQDVAMQLVDVCSMQEPTTDPGKQQRPFFIKLQVLPPTPPNFISNKSPPLRLPQGAILDVLNASLPFTRQTYKTLQPLSSMMLQWLFTSLRTILSVMEHPYRPFRPTFIRSI